MLDLQNNQYDMKILKENIAAHYLWDILKTQVLTKEFCVKYILNKNYQMTEEQSNPLRKKSKSFREISNGKQLLHQTMQLDG